MRIAINPTIVVNRKLHGSSVEIVPMHEHEYGTQELLDHNKRVAKEGDTIMFSPYGALMMKPFVGDVTVAVLKRNPNQPNSGWWAEIEGQNCCVGGGVDWKVVQNAQDLVLSQVGHSLRPNFNQALLNSTIEKINVALKDGLVYVPNTPIPTVMVAPSMVQLMVLERAVERINAAWDDGLIQSVPSMDDAAVADDDDSPGMSC